MANGTKCVENMKQTIQYFDSFLELYEDSEWMESATNNDISRAFRLASFLEKLYQKFESCNTVAEFERVICQWWEKKGRTSPFELCAFEEACDLLLTAFLSNPKVKTDIVFLAINEYIKSCDKTRLELLLDNLITEGVAFRILFLFLSSDKDAIQNIALDVALMSVWCKKLECGNKDVVQKQVSCMINDVQNLEIFLKILAAPDSNDDKHTLKLLILDVLRLKIEDHASNFGHALVTRIDKCLILAVCKIFPGFLSALLEFVCSVGKYIKYEWNSDARHYEWVTKKNSQSVISGLEFENVVQLLKCLVASRGSVGSTVQLWLAGLQSNPECTLWEDVEALCDC